MDFNLQLTSARSGRFALFRLMALAVSARKVSALIGTRWGLRAGAAIALVFAMFPAQMASTGRAEALNSWRGIRPLRSSSIDVARSLGLSEDSPDGLMSGPFKVEGGEVTFSYLTPSLAKIYRAPRSMVGKVFTIYFEPDEPMSRDDIKPARGFKRCVEQLSKGYYYFVSDAGLAYQFRRDDDQLETIIYQPTRSEIQRLAVNTECVF